MDMLQLLRHIADRLLPALRALKSASADDRPGRIAARSMHVGKRRR